ncbi:MAG: reductase [Chitinophagaceae bacterium]|nr:MAG: reductase [Chitinophagaceae bacterium]
MAEFLIPISKNRHMRKLIMGEWISLDGYAADASGSTDFFTQAGFNDDPESNQDIQDLMNDVDTIILGTNTYKLFVENWPQVDSGESPTAKKLNETRKLIFSNSLDSVEWGKWKDVVELVKGDAIASIKKLKTQPGKQIMIWGSISLCNALIKAGLIDEIHLRICPVTLGSGLKIFDMDLQLHNPEVKKYDKGMILAIYKTENIQS